MRTVQIPDKGNERKRPTTPPNRGSGYGAARVASGSRPRATSTRSFGWRCPIGDLRRAPRECPGALVRGSEGDGTGCRKRVPKGRAPKCPLRLWAHTRGGNHQSVPGRKAEVKEDRVPGPSYGLTWAARYAGGGRRCPCVDRYLSAKKKGSTTGNEHAKRFASGPRRLLRGGI